MFAPLFEPQLQAHGKKSHGGQGIPDAQKATAHAVRKVEVKKVHGHSDPDTDEGRKEQELARHDRSVHGVPGVQRGHDDAHDG